MNIVVLSRNQGLYSTQAIVEAARIRNHHVRVIDHVGCDLIIGSGKSRILFNNHPVEQVDAIIPRIGAAATSHGVAVIRQFESQGIFTTLQSDALLKSRNKLSCLQILSSQHIRVPKTVYVSNIYTIPELLREVMPYPVIIKLISGTQGMGVILAESEHNAISVLEAFQTTGEKVILQKFIKEANGTDIRAFVVDGVIAGAMKRQAKAGDFRSNLHRGGTAEAVHLTPAEQETAVKAAEVLGLSIAGVDMLRTHSGPMVLEVNASPGLEGIETSTGFDIAGKIISFVEKAHRNG
jgi:ribosomal protein S6--L-glutamate ligase